MAGGMGELPPGKHNPGCKFSTGPRTNSSVILVTSGKIGVILIKLIDYSGKLLINPQFAVCI